MAQFSNDAPLSWRYQLALSKAFEWHCNGPKGFQMRKDGSPYIAHPLAVSTLILENGKTEDEGIGGLLHDVIEDAGVLPKEITTHLGTSITEIVLEVSESKEGEWRDRFLAYINQIQNGSKSAVLVSLADKTHNGLSYLKGARIGSKDGSQSKTEQTMWFLGELEQIYKERLKDCYLIHVFEVCLEELDYIWSQ